MYKLFLFFLPFTALAACQKGGPEGASPEILLREIAAGACYISPDEVAARIIQKDPALRLVDVRTRAEFEAFTLQGAFSIPLKDFLSAENQSAIDCGKYDVVFFSNDDLAAGHAWQLSRRLGCSGCLIMQGGLNAWAALILNPAEPAPTASAGEMENYRFREAARLYFTGGSTEFRPEPFAEPKPAPAAGRKKIEIQPRPQKPAAGASEEGC